MKTSPILTPAIIRMLRGEVGYDDSVKDVAECMIAYYKDGKSGEPEFSTPCPPQFNPAAWERMEQFLHLCWDLGRADAFKARKAEATA